MTKIFTYLTKKDWTYLSYVTILILAQVWLDLKLPDYMSAITTSLESANGTMADIWSAGLQMLLCVLASVLAAVMTGYFIAQVGARLASSLRQAIFEKTMDFSLEEMSQYSTASLITRSTNDVVQVQNMVTIGLQLLIKGPIMAVWSIGKIAGKNMTWTIATGISILILIVVIAIIMALALPKTNRIQGLTDDLNRVTREQLTGIRVIHAYNGQAFQAKRFNQTNDALTTTAIFVGKALALLGPTAMLIMNGLSLVIYVLGAGMIEAVDQDDKLPLFSDMIVFSSYAIQVITAFVLLIAIFMILPRAIVSMKRIAEVLTTDVTIKDAAEPVQVSQLGRLTFENVSFRYKGAKEDALTDLNFTVEAGQTVAFIGATGSGKTSLLNLIPRLYDVTAGRVLVNGQDVKDYALKDLRGLIGYVPQQSFLFRGTISSNINYGENKRSAASLEAIQEAAEVGQAKEFIEKKAGIYEGLVEQGGRNFSGGQRQRLTITRAIYRDPAIYIFDDSFSALDYKTDRVLRERLRQTAGDATVLIVGQRIGTIRHADKIIVLDQGRMVGQGTHEQLMETCPVYQDIALSQLSTEEV